MRLAQHEFADFLIDSIRAEERGGRNSRLRCADFQSLLCRRALRRRCTSSVSCFIALATQESTPLAFALFGFDDGRGRRRV